MQRCGGRGKAAPRLAGESVANGEVAWGERARRRAVGVALSLFRCKTLCLCAWWPSGYGVVATLAGTEYRYLVCSHYEMAYSVFLLQLGLPDTYTEK